MLLTLAFLAHSADVERITVHLDTVETTLRARSVQHLDAAQRANRGRLLDALHNYHLVGDYPHNLVAPQGRPRPVPVQGGYEGQRGSTPVFVDEEGTYCAVGYLLGVDGQDALVARIVAGGNLRYVHEMHEPALLDWAQGAGFTVDELAMIQPSYADEDEDNDGWMRDSDCDDQDKKINPDADEVCGDGVDNNCDGEIDEVSCEESTGCNSSPAPLWMALFALPLFRRRR